MVMMLLIMELWVGPTLAPDRCLALFHISPPNYCSILIFKVTAIHLKQHWIFQKMQISSIEAYLVNIVKLGRRCGILWFFNLSSAETLILSLKFDQFDPFSQMTQKVCQKSAIWNEKTQKFWKNSEILSRLKSLFDRQKLGFQAVMEQRIVPIDTDFDIWA